jgi:hypothetical protein
MTREEWFTKLEEFLDERIIDAPDDETRHLAEDLLEEITIAKNGDI